jgi:hypothetical protein
MRTINLTQGYSAIIDDIDYPEISKHKWHVQVRPQTAYAVRWGERGEDGKPVLIMMHRQILGVTQKGMHTDHVNHNGLDNRRSNLREATPSENSRNRRSTVAGGRSKFKGVFWDIENQKWAACITKDCKPENIGFFDTQEEAAKAYDVEANIFWGDSADLNF